MKFFVLGVTGKRASGKDTVAHYLRDKYDFEVLTYTDNVLSPILKKQRKRVTRENLINLALEMRKKRGNYILTAIICEKIEKDGFWVISGVRYPEEYDHFKTYFGDNFKMINVVCESRKRYKRAKKRGTKGEGKMTFDQFMEIEKRETERIINKTIELADFKIDNNGSIEDLKKNIDRMAKEIGLSMSL